MLIMRFLFLFIIVALLGFNNVSHSQNPDKNKNVENKKDKKKKDVGNNTKEVIAEGVGDSHYNAIKDAFRNAVRQVVGVYVDSETLVKNDKLVDDKILTLSKGFIKTFSEVKGSTKVQGGSHRVTIKAIVETGGVIAKLKASNISIKEVDGKGLFAEVLTKGDIEKASSKILKKILEEFSKTCVSQSVISKHEIIKMGANGATIRFLLQINHNEKVYEEFNQKLIDTLGEICKSKGGFTANFKDVTLNIQKQALLLNTDDNDVKFKIEKKMNVYFEQKNDPSPRNLIDKWMPEFKNNSNLLDKDYLAVAVATGRNQSGSSVKYNYFMLSPELEEILKEEVKKTSVVLVELLDGKNKVLDSKKVKIENLYWAYGNDGTLKSIRVNPQNAKRSKFGVYFINNTFINGNNLSMWHFHSQTYQIEFQIGLEDLKHFEKVKLSSE